LLAPMLDRLERLPAPQLDALRISFGVSPGQAPSAFSSAWPPLSPSQALVARRSMRKWTLEWATGSSSRGPRLGKVAAPAKSSKSSLSDRTSTTGSTGTTGARARSSPVQTRISSGSASLDRAEPPKSGEPTARDGLPLRVWRRIEHGDPRQSALSMGVRPSLSVTSPQPEADVEWRRARSRQLDSGTVQLDCCRAGVAEPDPQRRAALEATRVAVLERALVHHRPALALTDSQPAGAGGRHGDCVPASDRVGRAAGVGDEGACHDGLRTRDWHGRCARQG
jgi:hypothetical protein